MAGILSSIALFVAVLILSNTLLPELGNQFTGTTTDENATTSSTLYKVVVYTGPLVVFLVSSLIFALCVRLGFIKSFITLLVGALATTLITTVAVFGLSQAGINQQKLNMAFQQAEQIEAVVTTGSNALSFDSEDNNKSIPTGVAIRASVLQYSKWHKMSVAAVMNLNVCWRPLKPIVCSLTDIKNPIRPMKQVF